MNKEFDQQILSQLAKQMHMSPEIILAHARGALSSDADTKVALHLKACGDCAKIHGIAKALLDEKDSKPKDVGSKFPLKISSQIESKLKLAVTLNVKKDKLVEKVARLFIPKDSWLSIRPAIIAIRSWHKYPPQTLQENTAELPVAAFASNAGQKGKQNLDTIIKTMNYIDLIHDLLLERCKNIEDVKKELPGCMDAAISELKGIELNEKLRQQIIELFVKNLSSDGKQH